MWVLGLALAILAASIVFALYSPNSFLRISPPRAPVAIFIGDSYAAGTGATAPQLRWTTLVAEAEGWQEDNYAYGGTGYVTTSGPEGCGKDSCPDYLDALDQALASQPQPEVIVVSGGRNDLGKLGLPTAVSRFYDQICLRKGNAQVIVVAPFWQSSERPKSLQKLSAQVEDASGRCGITYLDLGSPLDGTSATVADDGVHPNDEGHRAIATAFERALANA